MTERAPRSSHLVLGTAAGALWFAACFFGALPAAILWLAEGGWRPASGALAWLGAALFVGAQIALLPLLASFVRHGRGTQVPLAPPRTLVVRPPYARVRNPMYLLYAIAIAGEALFFGSVALAVYLAAFCGTAHAYVVWREEPALRARFGAAYEAYCARVPRWWPRLRAAQASSSKRRTLPEEVRGSESTHRNSRGIM